MEVRLRIQRILYISLFLFGINAQAGGIVDTHAHLNVVAAPGEICDTAQYADVIATALSYMNQYNIRTTMVMSQPMPDYALDSPNPCKVYDALAQTIRDYDNRFVFLGGGSTLNPMLQTYADPDSVTPQLFQQFEATAMDILRAGAVGFGELTAEHFSLRDGHPYEAAPPDHPFLLALADIAGKYNVPIDLHMEALPHSIPTPKWLLDLNIMKNSTNPGWLNKNIAKLETLLRHNRRARIVWVHVGWDNSSYRLAGEMHRLLAEHPNLFMSIKQRTREGQRLFNRILDRDGVLKPKWHKLFREFPDRFLIGQDQHYPNNIQPEAMDWMQSLLDQLEPRLKKRIASRNAVKLYNLSTRLICHRPETPHAKTIRAHQSAVSWHMAHGDNSGPC